jgi:uncharacterized protein YndB with AHSA1/START domain
MRYVLIAVGILAVVVGAVAVIGWSLPTHHRVTLRRAYRATPSALFALISDVRAFPSWRSDVKTVEVLPEDGGRLRWREGTKNGSPITYALEQSVPDQLLVGRIADEHLPFGGSWTYELAPDTPNVTTLSITEDGEVYNPIFRFVSRYVMGQSATIERYLDDVAKRFPPAAISSAPSSGSSSR